jgi:hypothetical protein
MRPTSLRCPRIQLQLFRPQTINHCLLSIHLSGLKRRRSVAWLASVLLGHQALNPEEANKATKLLNCSNVAAFKMEA